jgi:bacterioferritin (cytochrome b1)
MEKGPIPEGYMLYGEQLKEPPVQEIPEAERLLNEFESHDVKEGEFIRGYKEFAEKSKDSLIRFLLQLIISDEEKHHAIIHAMAANLKGNLQWTKQQDALPTFSEMGEEKKTLLKLTADFIEHEKEGIKETKKLIKVCQGYYQGLFSLLLQATLHDSEKHVEVLEFLHKRLKES